MPAQSAQGRTPAKSDICDEEIVSSRRAPGEEKHEDPHVQGRTLTWPTRRLHQRQASVFLGVGFAFGPAGCISIASASGTPG